jgi:hypothetical protein
MSFREKSAWISTAATLVVWGWYFVNVFRAVAGGEPDGERLLALFVGCVVLNVVIEVVLAIAVSALAPRQASAPADERERLIGLKATGFAYHVVVLGVLGVALAAPFLGHAAPILFPGDPLADVALVAANGILFAVVAAELVRSAGQIVLFRRGG